MKIRLFFYLLGLFALGVSCTSVSSEEDMYALALKKESGFAACVGTL